MLGLATCVVSGKLAVLEQLCSLEMELCGGLAVLELALYSPPHYLPQVYELGYLFNFFKSMPEAKLSEAVVGLDELISAIRGDIAADPISIVLQDELATCLLLKVRSMLDHSCH